MRTCRVKGCNREAAEMLVVALEIGLAGQGIMGSVAVCRGCYNAISAGRLPSVGPSAAKLKRDHITVTLRPSGQPRDGSEG